MASNHQPEIGDWYRNLNGDMLEIVAYDEEDQTVEVQYFDGTVEEMDFETWFELAMEPAEPPEDWSGSMDIQREDYGVDLDQPGRENQLNPLDHLDNDR